MTTKAPIPDPRCPSGTKYTCTTQETTGTRTGPVAPIRAWLGWETTDGRKSIRFRCSARIRITRNTSGIRRVKAELTKEGIPFSEDVEIGIMIETPAAVLMSDRLAKEVDFFSCGTNDLTQYTLACDRQNADLGRFYDPHHPAVLRALKMVCDNAHKNGVWVGICGELGADLTLTETFLSIGIDELSVSPRSVLPLRQKIREVNVAAVKEKILAELLSDETRL